MENKEASKQKMSTCVIIPYYNGSKYIERSAKSVLDQTVQPDEFVVVNDGSSPEESEKLKDISKKMGFKVLNKENGGQGDARNYGVSHTKSEFISFLDQDDFYTKDHLEILINHTKVDDPYFGWIYGDLIEAEEDGSIVRRGMLASHSTHPKVNIFDLINQDMFVLPSASLIKREAYESVGGFDPQFIGYEDDDLFLRIFRRGYTNYFVNKPVTVWCINSNSTSYSIKMSRSRLKYIKKLMQNFPDDPDKRRFFLKDLVFPRFNQSIFGEAIRSINPSSSEQDKKMSAYSDELIEIMDDYVKLVLKTPSVTSKTKRTLRLQSFIIKKKSKFLIKTSVFLWVKFLAFRKLNLLKKGGE